MTDNEIIKALKCCKSAVSSCEECPMYVKGVVCHGYELNKKALYLINRQQAEIERLNSLVDDHLWDFCSIAGCEGASNDCWKTCPDSRYNKIKNEAVKQFAEKVKEIKVKYSLPLFGLQTRDEIENYADDILIQLRGCIDTLVKEMVGDTCERNEGAEEA